MDNIQTREKIECKPTVRLYKDGKMVSEIRRPNDQEIRDLVDKNALLPDFNPQNGEMPMNDKFKDLLSKLNMEKKPDGTFDSI